MYAQTISNTAACIYLYDMRYAIDRNTSLNKTNCLNLHKLMLNIGKTC